MTEYVSGRTFSAEVKVDYLEKYRVFTTLNIKTTDDSNYIGQNNFDIIIQALSFRTLPAFVSEPKFSTSLYDIGSPTLIGPGYSFIFGTEQKDVFENFSNNGTLGPVGYLIDELNDISISNGIIKTTSNDKNIEFIKL